MQTLGLCIRPLRRPVLRVPRIECSDKGVRIQLGECESRDHMKIVLLPFEVKDELHSGTEGREGSRFDSHSNEAADYLVGP